MRKSSTLIIAFALCAFMLSPLFERIAHSQGPSTPPAGTNPPRPKGKFRRVLTPIPGQYNVALDQSTLGSDVATVAADLTRIHGGTPKDIYRQAIRGFSIHTTQPAAMALSLDTRVEYVEEDGKASTATTQTNAPWGLDRIDQSSLPLDGTYSYTQTGAGVNAYVIDSGIWLSHQEFGGRAIARYDYFRMPSDCQYGWDCNKHGTLASGIIGGSTYGVAKNVTLNSVRVADCLGLSTVSSITAGVDWVTANHISPAVANLSVQASPSDFLDTAVRNCIAAGVTCVVAAGNGTFNNQIAVDAINQSPARVTEALTVGATDESDYRAFFSNFGQVVDLFAPGDVVNSATIGTFSDCQPIGNTNPLTLSGTSLAAPFVTGAVARYLQGNPTASPSVVAQWIVGNATAGKMRDRGASFSQDVPYDGTLFNYSLSLNGIDGYVNVPSSSSL